MPLYEYECQKCGHRFEKIEKFSAPLPKACPECKGKVRRLPSAPAIQFKGSGWYITDYARKSSSDSEGKEKASSEEKPAKEGEKKEDKKEDKKEEKKPAEAAAKSSPKKTSED